MSVFDPPKPTRQQGGTVVRYAGDDETKSTKGTTSLLDGMGVLTLASFPYRGQLYHVVADFRKTYLTKVVGGKFVSLHTLSSVTFWTYDPAVFVTPDKHSILFFDNENASGYVDIFGNVIKVVRQK